MADPHLDHPGEISWFPGKGPAAVLGPCPHRCEHFARAAIAWGPDFEHYTLDECRDAVEEGGCGGACRAWSSEVPIAEGPGKGRIRYSWSAWLNVQREPDPRPAEEPPVILAGVALPTLPAMPLLAAAELGPDYLAALHDRRDRYLAEAAASGVHLSTEQAEVFGLGFDVAVTEVLAEISARGWIVVQTEHADG